MSAFMGKVLWVDLSSQTFTEEQIPDSVYREYLSGIGLAAYLLYDRIPAGADPLGPENILGFVSGLLTGTPSLFSGRWMAVGKSPLTGTWGDANCGGYFSLSIKQCGYDGIFFTGISDAPGLSADRSNGFLNCGTLRNCGGRIRLRPKPSSGNGMEKVISPAWCVLGRQANIFPGLPGSFMTTAGWLPGPGWGV